MVVVGLTALGAVECRRGPQKRREGMGPSLLAAASRQEKERKENNCGRTFAPASLVVVTRRVPRCRCVSCRVPRRRGGRVQVVGRW